jgi:hypothetical protein
MTRHAIRLLRIPIFHNAITSQCSWYPDIAPEILAVAWTDIKPGATFWVAGLVQLFHTQPVRLAGCIEQPCWFST